MCRSRWTISSIARGIAGDVSRCIAGLGRCPPGMALRPRGRRYLREPAPRRADAAAGGGGVPAVATAAPAARAEVLGIHRVRRHGLDVRDLRPARHPRRTAGDVRASARYAVPRLRRCCRRPGHHRAGRRWQGRPAGRYPDPARRDGRARPGDGGALRAPVNGNAKLFQARLAAALPEAERYLDRLATNAIAEARRQAADPRGLITLVRQTRTLSAG